MESFEQLVEACAKLTAYFIEQGAREGIAVVPTEYDDRTLGLIERLYNERRGDREISIVRGGSRVDSFTKATGMSYEIGLLYISAPMDGSANERLWSAYVGWLHQGTSSESVLGLLDDPSR